MQLAHYFPWPTPFREIGRLTQMQNITVLGGSGFIGTRLIRRLSVNKQLRVNIIDKLPSRSFSDLVTLCDVRSLEDLRSYIPEKSVIINHRDDVSPVTLYGEVNIGGAINICQIATEKKIQRIIFTSTVAVYGFAPIGTDESGKISPFNHYGRTKYEAEKVFMACQAEDPHERTLVIIRPTAVFGEQNRGNVYNLLKQVASARMIMVGDGKNRKSIAYVENVAAFIEYAINFKPGIHLYNYIDKPDFSMDSLVKYINKILGRPEKIKYRLPYTLGLLIGYMYDIVAAIIGKPLNISSIRVKKFSTNSVYHSSIDKTGFVAPIPIDQALERTVRYEFIESHVQEGVFYTE